MEARVLEELRSVIEDEVDAGQLLKGLQRASSEQTLEEVALESVGIC